MSLRVELRHRYPSGFALEVAFEAGAGVTALFGRSGAGKSTVVEAVAGLLRPEAGRVVLDDEVLFDTAAGVRVPVHRRRIGYVFQDHRLFPHLSVAQNLGYGQRFLRSARPPRTTDITALLGLEDLMDRRPAELSGGERSRVAIGRALLSAPRLLLLDEPLAALDAARKAEILPYLERLRDESGVPMLYVSHAVAEVARLASEVVVLDDGCVRAQGPAAEIFADPGLAHSFGIRAAGAVMPGRVVAHHADGLTEVAISGGQVLLPRVSAALGAQVRIRIEAQDVILSRSRPDGLSALNILAGKVVSIRQGEGPGVLIQLACGDDRLLARVTRRSAAALCLAPGVTCHAVIKTVAVSRADVGVEPG